MIYILMQLHRSTSKWNRSIVRLDFAKIQLRVEQEWTSGIQRGHVPKRTLQQRKPAFDKLNRRSKHSGLMGDITLFGYHF